MRVGISAYPNRQGQGAQPGLPPRPFRPTARRRADFAL